MEKYIVPGLPTPYFVVDESLLIKNLEILKSVCDRAGCKILLAQKAFSMYRTYPLISRYLYGTTASGLHEARLGKEEFPGETHVFSPAYREDEFEELLTYADHFVFNSPRQVEKFGIRAKKAGKQIGLRINPQCSTQEGHEIYDPCADGSRLGTTLANFDPKQVEILDGLHFHTLCEQNSDDLETTVIEFEKKFGKYLHSMKWLNLGGGHHITRKDYDIEKLINIVKGLKKKYNVEFYLEPGEAVVLNAGFLVTSVMEAFNNVIDVAIVDTSAACHMPDVLEMPYRPPLIDSGKPYEKKFTYRLGSQTCLSGDFIGEYSFDIPLDTDSRLVFADMAIYTMVKNNTFNGMGLPSIIVCRKDGTLETLKEFGYDDFKMRL